MATTKKLTVKLLVDKKTNKVLFAEAGKDFVDFLIGLLSLPLASVIQVLTKETMVGCLGELYESVDNLDDKYIQSSVDITHILKPTTALTFTPKVPQLTENYNKQISCLKCSCHMPSTPVSVFGQSSRPAVAEASTNEEGFVEGAVTYMVMDDLVVEPLSTISIIMVLKKFNIDNFMTSVHELVVDIGTKEGLELLRASLQSKTVLSDVFLSKKDSEVQLKHGQVVSSVDEVFQLHIQKDQAI